MFWATKALNAFGVLRGTFSPNVQQKPRKEAGTLKHYGSSFLATCSDGHTDTDVLKNELQGFPGGPVVKTPHSNAGALGSLPGWGTKIPHVGGGPPSPGTTITEAHVPRLESLHEIKRDLT